MLLGEIGLRLSVELGDTQPSHGLWGRGEEVVRSSYEGHEVTVLLATFLFTRRSIDHRCPLVLTFFVRLQVLFQTDWSALKKARKGC